MGSSSSLSIKETRRSADIPVIFNSLPSNPKIIGTCQWDVELLLLELQVEERSQERSEATDIYIFIDFLANYRKYNVLPKGKII